MAIRIKPIGRAYEPRAIQKVIKSYIDKGVEEIANELAQNITIRVQPNWIRKRTHLLLRRARHIEKGYEKKMAEYIAEYLRKGIFRQKWKSRWKPLSEKYHGYKLRKGLDTRILLAYHYYVNSITAYRSGSDWVVGIKPFQKHPKTGIAMEKLAKFLEFGTRKMPARPHWRPAFKEAQKSAGYILRRYLRDVKAFR